MPVDYKRESLVAPLFQCRGSVVWSIYPYLIIITALAVGVVCLYEYADWSASGVLGVWSLPPADISSTFCFGLSRWRRRALA